MTPGVDIRGSGVTRVTKLTAALRLNNGLLITLLKLLVWG